VRSIGENYSEFQGTAGLLVLLPVIRKRVGVPTAVLPVAVPQV
jgi:hypothetical protein